jgi:hypothetical protein
VLIGARAGVRECPGPRSGRYGGASGGERRAENGETGARPGGGGEGDGSGPVGEVSEVWDRRQSGEAGRRRLRVLVMEGHAMGGVEGGVEGNIVVPYIA